MYNYGYSPYPESPFGQIGGVLGGIGQQASQWIPALLQLRDQQRQQKLQALQMFRQFYPNQPIPPEMLTGLEEAVPGLRLPRTKPTPGIPAAPAGPPMPGVSAIPGRPQMPGIGAMPGAAGSRPVLPAQPGGQIMQPTPTLADRPLKELIDPQKLAQLAQRFPGIENATVAEAASTYPEWRFYLQQGAGGQGGTFGDYFPFLKDDPTLRSLAGQSVPMAMMDLRTGQPDYAKMEAYIRSQETALHARATPITNEAKRLETRANGLYQRALNTAQTNPEAFQAVWSGYWKAVNDYNKFIDDHPEAQMQRMEHETLSQPALEQMGAKERRKETRADEADRRAAVRLGISFEQLQLSRQRTEAAFAGLGIRQQQLQIAAARLDLSRGEFAFRIEQARQRARALTPDDLAVIGIWKNPPVSMNPKQQAELNARVAALLQKVGLTIPPDELKLPERKGFWQGVFDAIFRRGPVTPSQPQPRPQPGSQQPGTAGSMTLSQRGQQAYTAYQQSQGRPIPKALWDQIPEADQALMTQMGVKHE